MSFSFSTKVSHVVTRGWPFFTAFVLAFALASAEVFSLILMESPPSALASVGVLRAPENYIRGLGGILAYSRQSQPPMFTFPIQATKDNNGRAICRPYIIMILAKKINTQLKENRYYLSSPSRARSSAMIASFSARALSFSARARFFSASSSAILRSYSYFSLL